MYPTPRIPDVHAALRWALDNDLEALLDHRRQAHFGTPARRAADARLVTRWQLAKGSRRSALDHGWRSGGVEGGSDDRVVHDAISRVI